jgi:hypothetical protein
MKSSVIAATALIFISASAHAQSTADVCKPILASGIQDTYNATGFSSSVARIRAAVCRQEMDTFSKANAAKNDLGLDVPGYFDLTFGGTTSSSNYQQRYSKFCSTNSTDIEDESSYTTAVSQANVQLASVFDRCVSSALATSGALQAWVRPSSDLKKLTVFVRKSGTARVVSFSATPSGLTCSDGLQNASARNPILVNGSRSFVCERANNSGPMLIAANTQQDGSLFQNPVEVPGLDETIAQLSKRVAKVEAQIVPKNTVAHFNRPDCPGGWEKVADSWRGRYLVSAVVAGTVAQVVGNALAPNENRVTGRHGHTADTAFFGGGCTSDRKCAAWGNGPARGPRDVPPTSTKAPDGMTISDGTNAPYVILTACVKS